jgi:hypothetical protein
MNHQTRKRSPLAKNLSPSKRQTGAAKRQRSCCTIALSVLCLPKSKTEDSGASLPVNLTVNLLELSLYNKCAVPCDAPPPTNTHISEGTDHIDQTITVKFRIRLRVFFLSPSFFSKSDGGSF